MVFMGTFTPKLDEKGRVFLPAKFRDRLAEGVVVTIGQENCLVVWPADVFAVEADRVASLSTSARGARDYQRMFFSTSEESTPDKQGRIGISATLRAAAGLDRDVIVIGVNNRLEVWDPARWADYASAAQSTYTDIDEPAPPLHGS
jgi:MraZ protein